MTKPPGLDLGDPRPAARAGLAALVVDGEEVADLRLERRRDALAQDLDRVGEGRARRRVQRVDLLGREARRACGTAAAARRAGSRRCRRCRSRPRTPGSAAGSSARPGAAGSASRQTSSVSAGSSASGPCSARRARAPAGRRRPAAGRPCPSGSGRGSGAPACASSAGSQAAPRVQRGGVGGRRPARAPKPRTTAVLAAACRPGAASWNRPVSIGLHDDRGRARGRQQELARAGGSPSTRWPTSACSSAGVPRTASGAGRLGRLDRPAGQRRVEGVGDDGQIGQFGHGRAIVARGSRVLDSPGPERQDS